VLSSTAALISSRAMRRDGRLGLGRNWPRPSSCWGALSTRELIACFQLKIGSGTVGCSLQAGFFPQHAWGDVVLRMSL
jgi:hypothetical protein